MLTTAHISVSTWSYSIRTNAFVPGGALLHSIGGLTAALFVPGDTTMLGRVPVCVYFSGSGSMSLNAGEDRVICAVVVLSWAMARPDAPRPIISTSDRGRFRCICVFLHACRHNEANKDAACTASLGQTLIGRHRIAGQRPACSVENRHPEDLERCVIVRLRAYRDTGKHQRQPLAVE